jgi:hypothetical protein
MLGRTQPGSFEHWIFDRRFSGRRFFGHWLCGGELKYGFLLHRRTSSHLHDR